MRVMSVLIAAVIVALTSAVALADRQDPCFVPEHNPALCYVLEFAQEGTPGHPVQIYDMTDQHFEVVWGGMFDSAGDVLWPGTIDNRYAIYTDYDVTCYTVPESAVAFGTYSADMRDATIIPCDDAPTMHYTFVPFVFDK